MGHPTDKQQGIVPKASRQDINGWHYLSVQADPSTRTSSRASIPSGTGSTVTCTTARASPGRCSSDCPSIHPMSGNTERHDTAQHIAEQAVKNNGVHASSERESVVVTRNNFVLSVDVDSEAVANQEQSGRCWMFSCLNFLRFHMERKLKLPKGSFELSQNYNFFYDKLEK